MLLLDGNPEPKTLDTKASKACLHAVAACYQCFVLWGERLVPRSAALHGITQPHRLPSLLVALNSEPAAGAGEGLTRACVLRRACAGAPCVCWHQRLGYQLHSWQVTSAHPDGNCIGARHSMLCCVALFTPCAAAYHRCSTACHMCSAAGEEWHGVQVFWQHSRG